jgi:hypothetical protein
VKHRDNFTFIIIIIIIIITVLVIIDEFGSIGNGSHL